MVTHRGGCHCARARHEFVAKPELVVTQCNCEIANKQVAERHGGEGDRQNTDFYCLLTPHEVLLTS